MVAILGLDPKELNTYVHAKTCMWMLIAVLLVFAKTWKYPRYSSVGEWKSKLWYIQKMEYSSVMKRGDLTICEKMQKKLKWVLLSEINQSVKALHCMIPTLRHSRKGISLETVKRSVVARAWA